MKETKKENSIICGIVMPISEIDGCTESHWGDVLDIINDAIEDVGFTPNLVSNADDVGVIHKRIIQNLYENPVVVCDISGKNPNVMFELGLRLAFDKPTIIIKDDKTPYSFDTSAIETLEYPRDLRFNKIQDFKIKLADKIKHTHSKFNSDPDNFSTFLKHFGEFKIAKIQKTEVSKEDFIIDELQNIRSLIERSSRRNSKYAVQRDLDDIHLDICCGSTTRKFIENAIENFMSSHSEILDYEIDERGTNHRHLEVILEKGTEKVSLRNELRKIVRNKGMKRPSNKRSTTNDKLNGLTEQ